MATEYDVVSRMRVEGVEKAKKAFGDVAARAEGVNAPMQGILRNAVAIGSAYVGLNAGIATFRSLFSGAVAYTSQLESTRIGLGSVLSAVENVNLEMGKKMGGEAFERLKDMALESVAGASELFQIYNGIVGPMRSAGTEMERIFKMTNNTAIASTALGVDLQQAQRDITLMVRGGAGMDVKMFSILRSMGLIKEETEEWNKKLTTAQRIEKLESALGGFEGAGKEYSKSWAGVWSQFEDFTSEIKRAFATPIMKSIASQVNLVNRYFEANFKSIALWASIYGDRIGTMIVSAGQTAGKAFTYVIDHLGEIQSITKEVMAMVREYAPLLARAAAAWSAINLAQGIVGKGMGAYGAYTALVSGAGAAAAGGGAAAAGGAEAAAGAAAAAIPWAAIIGALGAMAAVGVAIYENFGVLSDFLGGDMLTSAQLILGVLQEGWGAVYPFLEVVGSILLVGLVPAFKLFLVALNGVLGVFRPLLKIAGALVENFGRLITFGFEWFMEKLSEAESAFRPLLDMFGEFVSWLSTLADSVSAFVGRMKDEDERMKREEAMERWKNQEGDPYNPKAKELGFAYAASPFFSPAGLPEQRKREAVPTARGGSTVNVEKMIIKQDFKNADPDRVVTRMLADITKQAERRVSSRFVGALTR